MQITVEKLPHAEAKVMVQLTEEETQKFMERAAQEAVNETVRAQKFIALFSK